MKIYIYTSLRIKKIKAWPDYPRMLVHNKDTNLRIHTEEKVQVIQTLKACRSIQPVASRLHELIHMATPKLYGFFNFLNSIMWFLFMDFVCGDVVS